MINKLDGIFLQGQGIAIRTDCPEWLWMDENNLGPTSKAFNLKSY